MNSVRHQAKAILITPKLYVRLDDWIGTQDARPTISFGLLSYSNATTCHRQRRHRR